LCASGAPGNLQAAIFAYNHASWYVSEVLAWAGKYSVPAGAAAEVISYALQQIGKPYIFGGTGPQGFDCSGLAMMAYRAAGIAIPRTSQEQWAFGPRIPASRVQPGDLVF
jgi:cell wall-associated NlpC family hydrolase